MKFVSQIILIMVAVTFLGCSNRSDIFEYHNEAPSVSFSSNQDQETLRIDSLKYNSAESYSTFQLFFEDDLKAIDFIDIENENERGFFRYNDMRVESKFTNPKSGMKVQYYPRINFGFNTIFFQVIDNFGKQSKLTYSLYIFENLSPVASVKATLIQQDDSHDFIFDALDSFDKDRKFGGKIVQYEWTVEGNTWRTKTHQIRYAFPEKGVQTIRLRVQDNNGEWSPSVSTKVTIL